MERKLQLNPVTFPLWWYTTGFGIMWQWAVRQFRYGLKTTSLMLFLRHMRHPLYGDYTRSGRIISFFLRVVLLFIKLIFLGVRILFLAIVLSVYIIILPLSLFMIFYTLIPA